MSKAWDKGSTRAYRKARQLVLDRDGHRCRAHADGWCARQGARPHQCEGTATQAHHTQGKASGDDPAYMVAACPSCNNAIGDPTKAPDPAPQPRTRW
ncbi:hypothetical protein EV186_103620 [Labedaea rhizosphaerae]|uniref:HNH endonuclease n=1 Tax=Labedaea rhizosphaerae TaxID=598644 RepID=A0A4R6SEZ7_LABRH|nr:hypothetical protein EV186_103620 [Labedaea rhizosphaerae]